MMRVRETRLPIIKLIEAIDGGQYRRAERMASEQGGHDEPMVDVLRADIAVYFGRLEQASPLLDKVKEHLEETHLAGRYALARGKLFHRRGQLEDAQDAFETAYYIHRLLGAPFYNATSLFHLARLKAAKRDYAGAEELLSRARELLREEGPENIERFEFLSGRVDAASALCRQESGDLETASKLYASAVELLRRSEEGRYYGLALNDYGTLLTRLGKYQEALGPLQTSIGVLAELGTTEDQARSRGRLARALIRLKNYDEAEALISEGIELARRQGDLSAGAICLIDLAEMSLLKGDWERARRQAETAIEEAARAKHTTHEGNARIVAGRVLIARGDPAGAEQQLVAALELAQRSADPLIVARASLYLGEALAPGSAMKGREHLNRAIELLAQYRDSALEQDLKRISDRYRGERITITPDNKLVVNGHLLPTWNAAKESVERFLLKNALEQSQDNQTKAGQILGITKVHVHDKRKQYGL